jgi:Plant mobile domain
LKQRVDDVYGHGGSGHSLEYFRALPARVRELVEAAGFGPFVQLLGVVRVDRAVLTALTERWWDTTNTFHFRFGEMTITPLDFAAITGLRVGGDPIPYDSSLVFDDTALRWFLGRVPRHSGGMATYGQFVVYWNHEPRDDVEAAQMARAYLLYLFGASLFPNRRSRVHLCYLAGLVDLRAAGRFDWGGSALCTLYCFLGAASRGVGNTVGGYWRVVEV